MQSCSHSAQEKNSRGGHPARSESSEYRQERIPAAGANQSLVELYCTSIRGGDDGSRRHECHHWLAGELVRLSVRGPACPAPRSYGSWCPTTRRCGSRGAGRQRRSSRRGYRCIVTRGGGRGRGRGDGGPCSAKLGGAQLRSAAGATVGAPGEEDASAAYHAAAAGLPLQPPAHLGRASPSAPRQRGSRAHAPDRLLLVPQLHACLHRAARLGGLPAHLQRPERREWAVVADAQVAC
jgi:hypothetical protein